MSEKTYLSGAKLSLYDEKIKAKMATDDSAMLDSAKTYTDEELTSFGTEVDDALGALTSALAEKAPATHGHEISDVTNLQNTLDSLQEAIDGVSSSGGGAFDFDAYANAAGYSYSYNSSTKEETITYGGSTFATRTNVKGTDQWTITTVCESMGVNTTKVWTKTDSGWTAS